MSKFCPLPFSHIAIRPNGRVFPCCNFRWDGVPEDLHLDHINPETKNFTVVPYYIRSSEAVSAYIRTNINESVVFI